MGKAMVSRTLSVHKEHEFLLKLETAGLSDEFAQRVIDSKGNYLATKVVRLIQSDGFELTTSQKRAREIMGKNFFGIEEAKYFGVNPTPWQLGALLRIPFSEVVLEESKNTHVLVAVFPLSILEIRDKVERNLFFNHEDAWYNNQSFAKKIDKVSWQLVRKIPVDNSISKDWYKQRLLLGQDDEVPNANVMVYTIIGHFLATGERLFENIYVHCLDVDSDGYRVSVGNFALNGLVIGNDWILLSCLFGFGLASARKF